MAAAAGAGAGQVRWTPQEDEELRSLVEKYGQKKWSLIATKMGTKASKQCRRRWANYLNLDAKKGGWSADEDARLLEGHRRYGNKWTEIARLVTGRTDNAVKNRFVALEKRERAGGTMRIRRPGSAPAAPAVEDDAAGAVAPRLRPTSVSDATASNATASMSSGGGGSSYSGGCSPHVAGLGAAAGGLRGMQLGGGGSGRLNSLSIRIPGDGAAAGGGVPSTAGAPPSGAPLSLPLRVNAALLTPGELRLLQELSAALPTPGAIFELDTSGLPRPADVVHLPPQRSARGGRGAAAPAAPPPPIALPTPGAAGLGAMSTPGSSDAARADLHDAVSWLLGSARGHGGGLSLPGPLGAVEGGKTRRSPRQIAAALKEVAAMATMMPLPPLMIPSPPGGGPTSVPVVQLSDSGRAAGAALLAHLGAPTPNSTTATVLARPGGGAAGEGDGDAAGSVRRSPRLTRLGSGEAAVAAALLLTGPPEGGRAAGLVPFWESC